jgi:hypothetical protein
MTSFPNFQKKLGSGHPGQPARRGARTCGKELPKILGIFLGTIFLLPTP